MLQKLPVNNFEWIKDTSQFNEDFNNKQTNKKNKQKTKTKMKKSDKGYFIEVDVQCLGKLHELHNDLSFLPERMKIEKVEKFVGSLQNKTEYVIQIRNLKQALNHRLVLKNVHRVIKFNQNVWIKPYIDMKTDLRKKIKKQF